MQDRATGRGARPGLAAVGEGYSDSFRRTLLIVLMVTWLLPIQVELAGQRLDPYRLVLLVMFIPFLAGLVNGKAGRFIWPDALVMAFCGWMVLTFLIHHGTSMLAFGGSLGIEVFGGYAAGRLLIRNIEDFRRFTRYMLVALLVLLPFVVIEFFTGRMLQAEILGRVFSVTQKFDETRYGFSRVQGGFPHSILYGLFCSLTAGVVAYLYRDKVMRVAPRLGMVILMTFASLSSAPILSIFIQAGIFMWGVVTRNRWRLLVWLTLGMILFLEVASNRGPAIILIETLTLDPQTGWWRYFIWVHVIENIKAHPIIGIGMNNWVRPYWMFTASVDAYWLVVGLRHGLVGLCLLLAAFAIHCARVVRARDLTPEVATLRIGYMVSFVGMCFTLTTVHVWGVVGVVVMFFLGAGSFIYTSQTARRVEGGEPAAAPAGGPAPRRAPVYARQFPRADRPASPSRLRK